MFYPLFCYPLPWFNPIINTFLLKLGGIPPGPAISLAHLCRSHTGLSKIQRRLTMLDSNK